MVAELLLQGKGKWQLKKDSEKFILVIDYMTNLSCMNIP